MEKPADILNKALDMSMDFGADFLKPINNRLQVLYPHLQEKELEEYNTLCRKVNEDGNNYVYDQTRYENGNWAFADLRLFNTFMLELYPWISEENLGRMYSQSCYFAMK